MTGEELYGVLGGGGWLTVTEVVEVWGVGGGRQYAGTNSVSV